MCGKHAKLELLGALATCLLSAKNLVNLTKERTHLDVESSMARQILASTTWESFHRLTNVELGILRTFTTQAHLTSAEYKENLIKILQASPSLIMLAEQNQAIRDYCLTLEDHWTQLLDDENTNKPFQIKLVPQPGVNSFNLFRARYYYQLSLKAARLGNQQFALQCLAKSKEHYAFFAEYQQGNADILFIHRQIIATASGEQLDEYLIASISQSYSADGWLEAILQRMSNLAKTYGTPGWYKKAEVEYYLAHYYFQTNQNDRGLICLTEALNSLTIGRQIYHNYPAITANAHHCEATPHFAVNGKVDAVKQTLISQLEAHQIDTHAIQIQAITAARQYLRTPATEEPQLDITAMNH